MRKPGKILLMRMKATSVGGCGRWPSKRTGSAIGNRTQGDGGKGMIVKGTVVVRVVVRVVVMVFVCSSRVAPCRLAGDITCQQTGRDI